MFSALVLIWVVGLKPPTVLEDTLGPYTTVERCFYRGASIIKVAVENVHYAIAKAETVCLQKNLEGKNVNFTR